MEPAEQSQLIAESLVSRWHADNRRFCGQGGGPDWQAKKSLIVEIAAALAGQLTRLRSCAMTPLR